ncbi:MAG: c-type cytochrome [Desulfobacterales bacterium]|nr:c-type cytochrome [Desulfobacterales bacterium]MDD4072695.1 c-type cytochrome [Desulfobacterales bacterium]MDD4393132.1 c-type cytochrome [Desulfobacterales bacterium]
MKVCVVGLMVGMMLLVAVSAGAQVGQDVFKAQKCSMCHKPVESKVAPSLAAIAGAYEGQADELLGYVKGEAEPVMDKERASVMEKYIGKMKALPEADLKALVEFMLGHK